MRVWVWEDFPLLWPLMHTVGGVAEKIGHTAYAVQRRAYRLASKNESFEMHELLRRALTEHHRFSTDCG